MFDSFTDFLIVAIPMFLLRPSLSRRGTGCRRRAFLRHPGDFRIRRPGRSAPAARRGRRSALVPCYNEGDNAQGDVATAAAVDYPAFEIIAINDGSRDNTGEVLDRLVKRIANLRVVHLAANQGKATALNTGALLAKHELLVCIDGDALLDPQALYWIARDFRRATVGGIAGNPRIRNRTSLLGRLQVGEFSSIIGLIRRAQTAYGRLFTVSGVICAFRKRALEEAGWWSPRTITDDIDVTWRLQCAGWRVTYEPHAIVWILMPETLKGLWKQRLRWAEGGVQMMVDFFGRMVRFSSPSLLPTYINYLVSLLWAYVMTFSLIIALLCTVGSCALRILPGFNSSPSGGGLRWPSLTSCRRWSATCANGVSNRTCCARCSG
jgi:biofilm PGA synthesis N-glycosyltransferase PgaC